MQVILFTQNSALNNIWRSYFTGNSDVKFIHNRKEFFSHINDDIDKYMVDKNITNFINKYSIEIIKGEPRDFIPNLKEKFFDEKKSGDALQNFA